MEDAALADLLHDVADAVAHALTTVTDWGLSGLKDTQYSFDVVADEACLAILADAPVGILSEESGEADFDADIIVVVDPVDGSTNCSHQIPWFATSLCAVVGGQPHVGLVANQASGERFVGIRGSGSWVIPPSAPGVAGPREAGVRLQPSKVTSLSDAMVGISGLPTRHYGWRQFREFGAGALDLCSVAAGRTDAYIDSLPGGRHGPWDYLGALVICEEAGVTVRDTDDRSLLDLGHDIRRGPLAAATPELADELQAAFRAAR